MKINWDKKYTTIAVYIGIVLLFALLCVFFFVNVGYFKSFLGKLFESSKVLIYGIVLAFLLNPLYSFSNKYIFSFLDKKSKVKKLKKTFSLVVTYIVFFTFISVFIYNLIPQISSSYRDLQNQFDVYSEKILGLYESMKTDSTFFSSQLIGMLDSLKSELSESVDTIQKMIPSVVSFMTTFVEETFNFIVGIIISVYLLADQKRLYAGIRRCARALSSERVYNGIISSSSVAKIKFGNYITGKLLNSLIFGIVCFAVMGIFKLPYYPLISLILASTNLIPYFGIFIGAIPCGFIVSMANPINALWFLIIIVVIKSIDSYFIEPKIIKSDIGLPPEWVLISVIVMGSLFGVIGMCIAVPVFALLYTLIKYYVESKLMKRNLPVETKEYIKNL